MTAVKSEKKKLSKSILEMKFMKKSKEKFEKEQDDAEGRAAFASEVTQAMRIGGSKIVIEPSFVPCDDLLVGRFSYHGMNPEIERLLLSEKAEKTEEKAKQEENEAEISDLEMARRYSALVGTIGNRFKTKNNKRTSNMSGDVHVELTMVSSSNYYEILGCDRNASLEDIKQSYREQVKRLHPDKSIEKDSREEFLALDKAWKTLRDPTTRREYDMTLSKNELEETPMYCEVDLEEMSHDTEVGEYTYGCRCGGVYVLQESHARESQKLRVSCDECTFHIVVVTKRRR
ncbi:hypothetical protein RUM43_004049 [Polyplax serrata]|uniref:Uncharacterized protein n=1 Tax=Polyplax serrata TaxID=468196 RepID=A0AAN8SAS0_POLSC